jgi:hypothetical protein
MPLSLAGYTDLQATALDFMERTGVTADVAAAPVWIQLAEAKLNRELGAVETDQALTGTINSRRIDISAYSFVEVIALFVVDPTSGDEVEVKKRGDGTFPYLATAGQPKLWAVDGTNIDFDVPCDAAYTFRMRYRQRFALATTSPNWLLTNHPDLYLAATLMWGAGYHEDWPNGTTWGALLDEGIVSVRGIIANANRGELGVDPMLVRVGQRPIYTGSAP